MGSSCQEITVYINIIKETIGNNIFAESSSTEIYSALLGNKVDGNPGENILYGRESK
ncbi:MAG: hypothetical protein MK289_02700 [Trichodesmium sp. ALOHA_ZT_67]|nr:hypothetical protein [Trichodesmium sp. ALOHA_ZT_67]MDE5093291.1 hypothetical protein [Trichodesmium sp. St11_bin5]MDT9340064.1 hypothetical protein [Trichodesmium erythraeum 21-75]